jgi:hypothetical protein
LERIGAARVIDLQLERDAGRQRALLDLPHARTGRRPFFCVSVTGRDASRQASSPVSPTWPPLSP